MDIKNYLLLLLSVFICFVAGHIIFRLAGIKDSSNRHFRLFVKLFTGVATLVFIYSVIVTKGKTINLTFIPIAIVCWYVLKKEGLLGQKRDALTFKISRQDLLILFETLLIATGWYLWTDHYFRNSQYTFASKDIIFYAKIAEHLNLTHNENFYSVLNLFDEKYHGTSPYHYFEIWLTAFYSRVFNILELISYIKLTMTLFLVIISTGIISIFRIYFNHNYFNLLVPLLLATQGIYITDLLTEIEAFQINPVNYSKYLTIYPIIIAAFFLFIRRRNLFFIPLLCLPVITISCAAGIFSSLVLFALLSIIFKNKIFPKQTGFIIIMSVFIISGVIAAFYSLTGIKEKSVFDTINPEFILNNLRTSINVFGATTLQVAYLNIIYISILFILFYFYKDRIYSGLKEWCLLSAIIYIISLSTWALLFQMRTSIQVFQNISIPFINLTIVFLFIYFASELKKNKSIFFPVLMIMMFLNCSRVLAVNYKDNMLFSTAPYFYSESFLAKINQKLKIQSLNPLGVFFFSKEEYDELPGRSESHFYTLGDYLKVMKPYYNTISLTVFDIPLGPVTSSHYLSNLQLVQSSVFYMFVDKQKNNNQFTTIEDAQVTFIKTNNIGYGIASKRAKLPLQIQSITGEQIVDETSGERFLVFKY